MFRGRHGAQNTDHLYDQFYRNKTRDMEEEVQHRTTFWLGYPCLSPSKICAIPRSNVLFTNAMTWFFGGSTQSILSHFFLKRTCNVDVPAGVVWTEEGLSFSVLHVQWFRTVFGCVPLGDPHAVCRTGPWAHAPSARTPVVLSLLRAHVCCPSSCVARDSHW